MSAALEISAVEPGTILISDLKRDPELICRAAGVNRVTAGEYAEAMKAGAVFPPVVVFTDTKGVHWLADGFHRTEAAELAGLTEIAAERHTGSRKDALLFAAGANAEHGRARSPGDKRRAVSALLNDAAWSKRSDNWIATHARVSQPFVSKLRATSNVISDPVRETADGREMDVSGIGKASDPDIAIVSKLFKQAERLIAQCPETKRVELWAHITSIFESKTEPEIVPPKKSNGGGTIIRAATRGAALDQS